MTRTRLSAVTGTYGHTAALKDGSVSPRGYELAFDEHPVIIQAFRKMVRGLEFDVCEMAFSTYLCAREHGVAFTALPLFLTRGLHHAAIVVNTKSGVRAPKDLEGRRVGVNRGWSVTTGVWARGILADEHGVDLDKVTWVLTGDEHVTTYRPPANVVPSDRDLAEMLTAGEVDAAVGLEIEAPGVAPLIRDPHAAAMSALWQRGFYPINHLLVVRDEVLAAHPDLAGALFAAYTEAKQPYVQSLAAGSITEPTANDRRYQQVMSAWAGGDPLPYGVAANRDVVATLIDHAARQEIIERRPEPEELFVADTLDLIG